MAINRWNAVTAVLICGPLLTGCQLLELWSDPAPNSTSAPKQLTPEEKLSEIPVDLKLAGQSGYLVVQPKLAYVDSVNSAPSSNETFQDCEKVTIIRLVQYRSYHGSASDLLEVSQGNNKYFISHLGSRPISRDPSELKDVVEWFLSKKPIVQKSGMLKLASGSVPRRKAVCEQKSVFLGMTSSEALYVLGIPDKINRTTSHGGVKEQWVYPSRKYFYFDNDVLASWQD
ncbi:MAG: hypothetical protein U1E10_07550 [Bdellovibrionales bacterium]|nr:hypothetical protein [Bdellovibrionales bacterium]